MVNIMDNSQVFHASAAASVYVIVIPCYECGIIVITRAQSEVQHSWDRASVNNNDITRVSMI